MLYYIILYYIILYLYYNILYYTILYYTILYYIILYYIILYYTRDGWWSRRGWRQGPQGEVVRTNQLACRVAQSEYARTCYRVGHVWSAVGLSDFSGRKGSHARCAPPWRLSSQVGRGSPPTSHAK